jgi:hypothetical protein
MHDAANVSTCRLTPPRAVGLRRRDHRVRLVFAHHSSASSSVLAFHRWQTASLTGYKAAKEKAQRTAMEGRPGSGDPVAFSFVPSSRARQACFIACLLHCTAADARLAIQDALGAHRAKSCQKRTRPVPYPMYVVFRGTFEKCQVANGFYVKRRSKAYGSGFCCIKAAGSKGILSAASGLM